MAILLNLQDYENTVFAKYYLVPLSLLIRIENDDECKIYERFCQ